jgi:hypothetical protein
VVKEPLAGFEESFLFPFILGSSGCSGDSIKRDTAHTEALTSRNLASESGTLS